MALSTAERKRLLALNVPQASEVRLQITEYLDRTGLTPADFAHRIGYSPVSMRFFMADRYEAVSSNSVPICAAAVDFIRAHPIADFQEAAGKLYATENVRLLRRYFNEALNRGRAYYVEGDPGTQKSFVLQHLVAELNRDEIQKNGHGKRAYYVYCPQSIRRTQLVKLIAQSCGSPSAGDVMRVLRNLRFDFRSRRVLLIFDESQHLDVECLETIRELHDLPPHFGLLFAGSHQLERMFARHALELEQWNSRFHAGRRLPGIGEEEAAEIIRGELGKAANQKVIEKLIKGARTRALSSGGEHEYISARRLFNSLAELTAQEATAHKQQATPPDAPTSDGA